jgi:hypothetical protein
MAKNDQPAAPEEGLFVSDVELYRRLGVGPRTGRIAVRSLQHNGFPPKDPLFGNKALLARRARFSTIAIFMADQLEMRRRQFVKLGRKILTRHAHGHGLDWRRRKKEWRRIA